MIAGCLSDEDSRAQTASDDVPNQNNAPAISGSPANAVTIGDTYSFTPTAWDPDGDALSFSVTNKPVWATFDSSTGTLSGMPDLGNVGSYENIQVAVSDGELSSSIPEFWIDVVDIALGSVTLTWTPPTLNENGTALSDLTAYRIYYGTESRSYTRSVEIDNPGLASYVLEDLVPDTYYFVATAVNSQGVESGFSNEAVKPVPE